MKRKTLTGWATLCGFLAWTITPVLAGPVELTNVRQVLKGNYQQGGAATQIDLRVNEGDNDPKKKSLAQEPTGTPAQDPTGQPPAQERPPITPQEEIIEDVTTVENCDCPDLPIPPATGGGFPKWLFGLAGLPLICFTGICSGDDSPPDFIPPPIGPPPAVTPTPTDTPPIPEPATIFLLGSGLAALGAAARRRHARNKAMSEINS